MGDYTVIFDMAREPFPFRQLLFPGLVSLGFIMVGMLNLFGPSTIVQRLLGAGLTLVGFTFAIVWAGYLWNEYTELRARLERGEVTEVVGQPENFRPDPPSGKGGESFSINGYHFELDAARGTAAFNQPVSRGGPYLRPSQCVRILFASRWDGDVEIVWLGIKAPPCEAPRSGQLRGN